VSVGGSLRHRAATRDGVPSRCKHRLRDGVAWRCLSARARSRRPTRTCTAVLFGRQCDDVVLSRVPTRWRTRTTANATAPTHGQVVTVRALVKRRRSSRLQYHRRAHCGEGAHMRTGQAAARRTTLRQRYERDRAFNAVARVLAAPDRHPVCARTRVAVVSSRQACLVAMAPNAATKAPPHCERCANPGCPASLRERRKRATDATAGVAVPPGSLARIAPSAFSIARTPRSPRGLNQQR